MNLTLFDAARVEAVSRASARGPMREIGGLVEREALSLVGEAPFPLALLGGVSTAAAGVLFAAGAASVALYGASVLEDASALTSDEYRQVQLGTLAGAGVLGALAAVSLAASGGLFYVAATE